MECRLSKVYESIKLFRGGHGQQRVGVEPEKRSRKRGVSVSGDTRAYKPNIAENLCSAPDDIFAKFMYKP